MRTLTARLPLVALLLAFLLPSPAAQAQRKGLAKITKTTTDLESGQVASESIRYKKNIFNLGLGGGFIISIK